MKRKIFTLLLAIGVLTAFQANAQQRQKIHIKADSSVLAKSGDVVRSDSFPFKQNGFTKWLSVDADKKLVLGEVDTVLEYDFYQTGFTNFRLFRQGAKASDHLVLKDSSTVKNFAILKLKEATGELVEKSKPESKEGYLVSVPETSSGSAQIDFSLVGIDSNGKLSLKKFNEFAIYGDSVPYAPFWAYQYDTDTFPGRLYQSNLFPYFQIYDTAGNKGLIFPEANERSNWAAAGNSTKVYSWLNIKLTEDSSLVLLGDTIRLDSIRHFADSLKEGTTPKGLEVSQGREWKGLDTTTIHRDSIAPFGLGTGSLYHVYLKFGSDSLLTFTVKKNKLENDSTDWTNGYPTKFPIKGNTDTCYYRIDTMFFSILPDIIDSLVKNKQSWTTDSLFKHVPRYLYKKYADNDSWRPLYVELRDTTGTRPVVNEKKSKYVDRDWVKGKHYHLSAAVQKIVGDSTCVSGDANGISLLDTTLYAATAPKFKFEWADSIKSDSTLAQYTELKFKNDGKIDLFRINNGSKYLTVLDTTEFTDIRSDSATVANTQLGWQGSKDSKARALQMFAIVHSDGDNSTTFLPVASRKGTLNNGTVTYDTDTLFFNLGIGQKTTAASGGDSVIFSGTWYLTKKAQLDSTDHKLVIAADSILTDRIWFGLTSTWAWTDWTNGPNNAYVSIKKGTKYYRSDKTLVVESTTSNINNDIKAHWKINKEANTVANAWKFTPVVDTIYKEKVTDKLFAGKPVFAFKGTGSGTDSILLVDEANENVVDTVHIGSINPKDFSLFKKLETTITDTTVIIVSGNKYITLGEPPVGNDSIVVAVAADTAEIKNPVKVTPSNVKHLVGDSLYPIYHYTFSIEKEDGKKYFLNAGDSIVRWVSLDATKETDLSNTASETYASFKFALPDFGTDKVYLQTLDTGKTAGPRVIQFVSGDSSKLESVDVNAQANLHEGIYSAIDFYNTGKSSSISTWGFIETEVPGNDPEEPGNEVWLSKSYFNFDGADKVKGVFTTVDNRYISYGVDKSGILLTAPDTLTLKFNGTIEDDTVTVATFNIVSVIDSLCLWVDTDGKAIFTDTAAAFAFCKEESGFAIVPAASIGAGSLRFLSEGTNSLIFTTDKDKRLVFTWGEREVNAIKAITASGKIYGVAGGVKVLGATGAVAIYTIDGRLVTKKTVTSPNQTIAVPAGIYIVRNGAEATKVVVK